MVVIQSITTVATETNGPRCTAQCMTPRESRRVSLSHYNISKGAEGDTNDRNVAAATAVGMKNDGEYAQELGKGVECAD